MPAKELGEILRGDFLSGESEDAFAWGAPQNDNKGPG
jgi:hypothetical protein